MMHSEIAMERCGVMLATACKSRNGATDEPVGFAVLQGYYGANNFTAGRALYLYNTTNFTSCTRNSVPYVYSFEPTSDVATTYLSGQTVQTGNVSVSATFGGYWTGGEGTPIPATYNRFPSGAYTVVAADEWGDVVLVHFDL
jgi:hypothetical protein